MKQHPRQPRYDYDEPLYVVRVHAPDGTWRRLAPVFRTMDAAEMWALMHRHTRNRDFLVTPLDAADER